MDDQVESGLVARATQDIEAAAADLLKKHSALRAVVVVVDWDLPEDAAGKMPLCIMRTQSQRFTNLDLERMIVRLGKTVGFICAQAASWCQAMFARVNSALETAKSEKKAPVPDVPASEKS